MKKFLGFALILSLLAGVCPVYAIGEASDVSLAQADEAVAGSVDDEGSGQAVMASSTVVSNGACGADVRWTLYETGELVIAGTGAMNDYDIQNSTPWYSSRAHITSVEIANGITSIGRYAFGCFSSLTKVSIPYSVTSIGEHAFYQCSDLTEITLPYGVETIGLSAFDSCSSLAEVTIPASVITIGEEAFYDCSSLTEITLRNGVTTIGDAAFGYCSSLAKVTISNSVTTIGDEAFDGCSALTDVYYPGASSSEISIGQYNEYLQAANWHYNYNIVPSGVCGDAVNWVLYDDGKLDINGTGAMRSAPWSSYRENIRSVVIGDGVTGIGDEAFYACSNLTEVTIPESVTTIGKEAFYNCSNLTEVTIPASVTSIDEYAFGGCSSLAEVTIPATVKSINYDAFENCTGLKKINFLGDMPSFCQSTKTSAGPFDGVTATAYYPCNNDTWTSDPTNLNVSGGKITWVKSHASVETVRENEVSATCVVAGSYDEVLRCSACGEVLNRETVTVSQLTYHTYGDWIVVSPPTYVTAGVERRTCTGCDQTEERSISPTGPATVDGITTDYDETNRTVTVEGVLADMTVVLETQADGRMVSVAFKTGSAGSVSFQLPDDPSIDRIRVFFLTSDWRPMAPARDIQTRLTEQED